GIGQLLEIFLGHLEEGRVFGKVRIGGDALLVLRAVQRGKSLGGNRSREERIAQKRRRLGVNESRSFPRQRGRRQPGSVPFHCRDELLVYRLITHAVREA